MMLFHTALFFFTSFSYVTSLYIFSRKKNLVPLKRTISGYYITIVWGQIQPGTLPLEIHVDTLFFILNTWRGVIYMRINKCTLSNNWKKFPTTPRLIYIIIQIMVLFTLGNMLDIFKAHRINDRIHIRRITLNTNSIQCRYSLLFRLSRCRSNCISIICHFNMDI